MKINDIKTKNQMDEAAAKTKTFSQAVRLKCLDCSAYELSEVRNCSVTTCRLWRFRMEGELIDFCKLNGVSLNEKRSGGKWLGSSEYESYMRNRDEILRRQRGRHNSKRGTELLKEKGYIPLL